MRGGGCLKAVEVAWYDDRIKVTIPGGSPASITQAYMTGDNQDVIVEIATAPEHEANS